MLRGVVGPWTLALLCLLGCSGEKEDTGADDSGPGPVPDSETDSDTDSDSDSDSDADTDSDTDTDTDVDSDADTDADTDTDSARDTAFCDRDACDTGPRRDTAVDTGFCDRDNCDSGPTRDTSVDTAVVCDRDDGCPDTGNGRETGDGGTETGTAVDSGDTAVADTAVSDSAVADTAVADSAVADSVADSAVADPVVADSAVADSAGDTASPAAEYLFLLTADWTAETGTLSLETWPDRGSILSGLALSERDNLVSCSSDGAFLLTRMTGSADSITPLDLATGTLGTPWLFDADSYPFTIRWIDDAWWVPLAYTSEVVLLDATGAVTETIDLSPYADADGSAEPVDVAEIEGYIYVLLGGHTETGSRWGTPQILQLDATTHAVNWQLELTGTSVSGLPAPVGNLLYIQDQGTYTHYTTGPERNLNGGFEIVDLAAGTTSGFVLDEATENATFDGFSPIPESSRGFLLMTDATTGVQSVALVDLDLATVAPLWEPSPAIESLAYEDGEFRTTEIDATTDDYAWVWRDASFTETDRVVLGNDLYSAGTCTE